MLSVLYVSTMNVEYSQDDFDILLNIFRNSNHEHNITGLMLYCGNNNIIQYLEGPNKSIERLYENISNDSRHKDVKTLLYQKIDERIISDWNLLYKPISDKTFQDFIESCTNAKNDDHIKKILNKFIKTYKK